MEKSATVSVLSAFIKDFAISIKQAIAHTLPQRHLIPCVVVTINQAAFFEMSMYLFENEWYLDAPCPIRHIVGDRRIKLIYKPDDDPSPGYRIAAVAHSLDGGNDW